MSGIRESPKLDIESPKLIIRKLLIVNFKLAGEPPDQRVDCFAVKTDFPMIRQSSSDS